MTDNEIPAHFSTAFNVVANLYGFGCEMSASVRQFNVFLRSSVDGGGPTNRDSYFYFGRGDPDDPAASFQYAPNIGYLIDKTDANGINDTLQYALCIVYMYSIWEHLLRPEIATAHGVKVEIIVHPALGDLRKIRNAILHRLHVLDGDLSYFNLFKRGEVVQLDNNSYYLILKGVFSGIKSIATDLGVETKGWEFDRTRPWAMDATKP